MCSSHNVMTMFTQNVGRGGGGRIVCKLYVERANYVFLT